MAATHASPIRRPYRWARCGTSTGPPDRGHSMRATTGAAHYPPPPGCPGAGLGCGPPPPPPPPPRDAARGRLRLPRPVTSPLAAGDVTVCPSGVFPCGRAEWWAEMGCVRKRGGGALPRQSAKDTAVAAMAGIHTTQAWYVAGFRVGRGCSVKKAATCCGSCGLIISSSVNICQFIEFIVL